MEAVDYSKWLTKERLEVEEKAWDNCNGMHEAFATPVNDLCMNKKLKSVVEFGCGTGRVLPLLHKRLDYTGVDANQGCVDKAIERAKGLERSGSFEYVLDEIRTTTLHGYDVVCAFSVMKHFRLDEWESVLAKVLSCGEYGIFSMPIGPEDIDDFSQGFPHTWVRMETVRKAIEYANRMFLTSRVFDNVETMVWVGPYSESISDC